MYFNVNKQALSSPFSFSECFFFFGISIEHLDFNCCLICFVEDWSISHLILSVIFLHFLWMFGVWFKRGNYRKLWRCMLQFSFLSALSMVLKIVVIAYAVLIGWKKCEMHSLHHFTSLIYWVFFCPPCLNWFQEFLWVFPSSYWFPWFYFVLSVFEDAER